MLQLAREVGSREVQRPIPSRDDIVGHDVVIREDGGAVPTNRAPHGCDAAGDERPFDDSLCRLTSRPAHRFASHGERKGTRTPRRVIGGAVGGASRRSAHA